MGVLRLLLLVLSAAACQAVGSPTATATGPQEGAASPLKETIVTLDGLRLCASLFLPHRESLGAVVLAHMFATDQTSWHPFAAILAREGYTALTFDFRGYGCSEGNREIARIHHDLAAAVDFLGRGGYPRVVVLGASMGGTAAAKVAAGDDLAGLVLLSAPLSFRGLEVTEPELRQVDQPTLFLGSRDDPATQEMVRMAELVPQPRGVHLFPGSAHGTFLLQTEHGPELRAMILEFLRLLLAKPGGADPADGA